MRFAKRELMKLKTYPVAWVVVPEGQPICDEMATRIEIEDELARIKARTEAKP